MPNVPALGRHGSGCAVQHRQLLSPDVHDGSRHRTEGIVRAVNGNLYNHLVMEPEIGLCWVTLGFQCTVADLICYFC